MVSWGKSLIFSEDQLDKVGGDVKVVAGEAKAVVGGGVVAKAGGTGRAGGKWK